MAMASDTLIKTEKLVKTFGKNRAVDGINLDVHSGEIVGLVGPDGAGKTTTMRLLCGALRPTSGTIHVAGYELPRQVEKARQHIGYLAQRFSLYGDLTVAENLDFFGAVYGVPADESQSRADALLTFAGLREFANRRAAALSGGMQKKLGLATALVHQPRVLLLDEPTGGVDLVARQEFWQLLIRLLRTGSAVVVSTPYLDEATRFNRVIFMHHGKVLVEGKPSELVKMLRGEVLELIAAPLHKARQIAQADVDVTDAQAFGDRLHLHVRHAAGILQRLPLMLAAEDVEVTHLRRVKPTLEDLFIQLVEDARDDPAHRD